MSVILLPLSPNKGGRVPWENVVHPLYNVDAPGTTH